MTEPKDSLIEYPCDFPIKVFGEAKPDFAQTIAIVVQGHAPDFDSASIEMRNSSSAKYISCCTTSLA
jgi:putative lipoic acid-binding regulatory protein